MNGHHTSRGERDHRDVARDIGRDGACDHQLGGRWTRNRRSQRKLLGMIDREQAGVNSGHDVRGRRRFRRCIDTLAASAKHQRQQQADEKKTDS